MASLAAAALLLKPNGGAPSPAGPAAGELAYPVPPREERIVVEVLNATDRTGLGRTATRLLRQKGFDVVSTGNAGTALGETRIVVRRGRGEGARALARALGTGRIVTELDTMRRVDLTVFLGQDFRPSLPLHP